MDRIETERLILRRAREDDLDAMHAVLSDPVAMRYWSTLPHDSIDQSREWLASMIAITPDEGSDFVIEQAGRVIGKVGCHRFPEIGYILHPSAWGEGFATEALGAVITHVFTNHPIDAIRADVDPRNAASIRLLRRLGFEPDGRSKRTWLIGDVWHDSVYFRLPRPGHPSRNTSPA